MCNYVSIRIRCLLGLAAVVSLCAVLTAASPSAAEQLAYDAFLIGDNPAAGEYVLGPIAGQAPYVGPFFGINGWVGSDAQVVQAAGLSYPGLPTSGGSVATIDDGFGLNGRVGRYLDTDWDNSTVGTYYISFLANFGTTTAGIGYRSVEFWPVGNDVGEDSGRMDIGYNQWGPGGPSQQNPATAQMCVNVDGQPSQIIGNAPASYNEDGVNHLLVVKFEMTNVMAADGDGDAISVYLDPTTRTEPEIPGAYFADVDYTLHAMGTVSSFGGGTTGIFDEIRVGTEFADVAPIPSPWEEVPWEEMFDIIGEHFNQTVTGGPADGDIALANGQQGSDGRVTLTDFRLWKDNPYDWPPQGALLMSAAVPEPSSLILVLVAAVACLGYAKARVGAVS
jgi:hypothetical protein